MRYYKVKPSTSSAKNTAWKWFSLYVRLRDAYAFLPNPSGEPIAPCFTCRVVLEYKDMDAGHGIPGRTNGILFDEEITKIQCRQCNRQGGGEVQAFKRKLVELHGGGEIGEAWYALKEQAKRTPTQISEIEFKAIGKIYQDKYNALRRKMQ
jgi:hypothetical protein